MNPDVARIIGWNPEPTECTNGGFSHEPPPYTADDLAAWLDKHHQKDWVIGCDRWDEVNSRTIYFGFALWNKIEDMGGSHWECDARDSTSILGALEQLILQIGAS